MLSPFAEAVEPLRRDLVESASKRTDVWPSRECAYEDLKSRRRTERWDPRVLDLYIVLHSLIVLIASSPE
jgi:7,8-dihydro-6-hydroxymethylpterin-pyrophosphokinase